MNMIPEHAPPCNRCCVTRVDQPGWELQGDSGTLFAHYDESIPSRFHDLSSDVNRRLKSTQFRRRFTDFNDISQRLKVERSSRCRPFSPTVWNRKNMSVFVFRILKIRSWMPETQAAWHAGDPKGYEFILFMSTEYLKFEVESPRIDDGWHYKVTKLKLWNFPEETPERQASSTHTSRTYFQSKFTRCLPNI